MPRYDHIYPPYTSSGNMRFCRSYPETSYAPYAVFQTKMQEGWHNSGLVGSTTIFPYPHPFPPLQNSESSNYRNTGDKGDSVGLTTIKGKTQNDGFVEIGHQQYQDTTSSLNKIGDGKELTSPTTTSQVNNRVKSSNRCQRLTQPYPSKTWSEKETMDTTIPEFQQLVNFASYVNKNRAPLSGVNSNQNMRCCVMCGKERRCTSMSTNGTSNRTRQGKSLAHYTGSYSSGDDEESSLHIIPRQNKGLCTSCDVAVWFVVEKKMEIKWCKGCKNFKPWAAFGDKGHATKCVRCRERQREKYATKKGMMTKNRVVLKLKRGTNNVKEEIKEDGVGCQSEKSCSFPPSDHGLSCLLAATAQVTASFQQGVDV